jgi:hypothetical protein
LAKPQRESISAGEKFGILRAAEKDSGHDVRGFGEELLFQALLDHNTDAIDYDALPPVERISQVIARQVKSRKLELNHVENGDNVYAHHDAPLSRAPQPDL